MSTVVEPATDEEVGWSPCSTRTGTLERRLEQHRGELTGFCGRMLGSFEAEDAVQETLVRAWLGFDRFEGRAALRSWLHRIAFNVCLDMLEARQRRTRRIEAAASSLARELVAPTQGQTTLVAAIFTSSVDAAHSNPAEKAVVRETVRLALAALVRLPSRQRAVLILRDVLRWKAVEVAELLDTTVAAVNSSLQRARSTLAARKLRPTDPSPPEDVAQREFLARCVDALERYDLEALTYTLRDDARGIAGASKKGARNAA
jgi:RNA polymerase sigma-70 factor (ECF subfamily)